MIICSQCGNKLAEDLRFCTECGSETPMFAATLVNEPIPPATIPYGQAPETVRYNAPQHPQQPPPQSQQPYPQPPPPYQQQAPSPSQTYEQQPPRPQQPYQQQPYQQQAGQQQLGQQAQSSGRPPYVPSSVPRVPQKSSKNAFVWVGLSFGVLVLLALAVVGVRLGLSLVTNQNSNVNRGGSMGMPAPYPSAATGRPVVCQYDGVHVRNAPSRTAVVLVDINKDQTIRVLRESTNRDMVFIPSLKKSVEDNWSEVEFEMQGVAYHGWIFSGFLR